MEQVRMHGPLIVPSERLFAPHLASECAGERRWIVVVCYNGGSLDRAVPTVQSVESTLRRGYGYR